MRIRILHPGGTTFPDVWTFLRPGDEAEVPESQISGAMHMVRVGLAEEVVAAAVVEVESQVETEPPPKQGAMFPAVDSPRRGRPPNSARIVPPLGGTRDVSDSDKSKG